MIWDLRRLSAAGLFGNVLDEVATGEALFKTFWPLLIVDTNRWKAELGKICCSAAGTWREDSCRALDDSMWTFIDDSDTVGSGDEAVADGGSILNNSKRGDACQKGRLRMKLEVNWNRY
jgi:hypothetical protein